MEGLRERVVTMGIDGTGQRNTIVVLKVARTWNGKMKSFLQPGGQFYL